MSFLKDLINAPSKFIATRRAARQLRVETRVNGRVAKSEAKWNAKAMAYESGIDPNKSLYDSIGGGINSITSLFGKNSGAGYPTFPDGSNGSLPMDNSQLIKIGGGILALVSLFLLVNSFSKRKN